MSFELVLVGFGHVAPRFVTLLEERRPKLADDYGLSARIVAVTTRRHGRAFSARGLDALSLVACHTRGEAIGEHDLEVPTVDFLHRVAATGTAAEEGRLVVVEPTTLDI